MPKMNLSDEEKRHIEQRRDDEKRFALGYNQAIMDLIAISQETGDDLNAFWRRANELRKEIRK